MFISKSFKELFSLTTFFWESGCKGKANFWTTKTFLKFFRKKFFRLSVSSKPSLCSVFQLYQRFSLESGCKITALQHIYQILPALFYKLFASFPLSRWFSKHAEEHKNRRLLKGWRNYTLLLYNRGEIKTENLLQELQTYCISGW